MHSLPVDAQLSVLHLLPARARHKKLIVPTRASLQRPFAEPKPVVLGALDRFWGLEVGRQREIRDSHAIDQVRVLLDTVANFQGPEHAFVILRGAAQLWI